MTSITLKTTIQKPGKQTTVPVTPRGRALHTMDWFLNGSPVLTNHDNPRLTLTNGQPCF